MEDRDSKKRIVPKRNDFDPPEKDPNSAARSERELPPKPETKETDDTDAILIPLRRDLLPKVKELRNSVKVERSILKGDANPELKIS